MLSYLLAFVDNFLSPVRIPRPCPDTETSVVWVCVCVFGIVHFGYRDLSVQSNQLTTTTLETQNKLTVISKNDQSLLLADTFFFVGSALSRCPMLAT